jgi:hypothetical protein
VQGKRTYAFTLADGRKLKGSDLVKVGIRLTRDTPQPQ